MIMKKKQILTATLMVALVAAVAVNWYYTRSGVDVSQGENETSTYESQLNLGDSLYVAGKVYENEASTDSVTEVTEAAISDTEYFANARLKQEQANDKIEDEIEDIIESEVLSAEDKESLKQLLTEYKTNIKLQTDIENLIISKLSCECIVIINKETAQVILPSGVLDNTVLLQITEIFEKNANIFAENLTIIEAK
ncbi:MAG: SpoIIIAH-like family protein [Clostridia bacterium]|nr:SpoIIIAH-like family protein [Clostridia bacterium]